MHNYNYVVFIADCYILLVSGAVLEGFLRFPETTQDFSLNDGCIRFQLQGFTRHTQRAE